MKQSVYRIFLAAALASAFLTGTTAIAQSPKALSPSAEVTLVVTVTNLRSDRGQLLIVLWGGPDGFPTKRNTHNREVTVTAKKAVNGSITASFQVVPGTYAISSLHDENSNGKMDFNLVGIPKEGYGISGPKAGRFHIPKFEEAAFHVSPAGQSVTIPHALLIKR